MDCPLGHGPLHIESHNGVEIDACAVCRGEWLDHEELTAMEAGTISDSVVLSGMIEYMPHDGERSCPRCGKRMYEFDYRGSPLLIDACGDGHGYWLDAGEEDELRERIRQRARDLHRAAVAEGSFASFLSGLRGQLGGGRGRPRTP